MIRHVAEEWRDVADRLAIHETLYRYCHAIDHVDRAAFLDCFAEHGRWLSRSRDDGSIEERGRGEAELGQAWDDLMRRRPPGGRHQLTLNPLVQLDGDRATALSYFVCIGNETGEAVLLYSGEYRDRLVREADGRWRFEERLILSGSAAQTEAIGPI